MKILFLGLCKFENNESDLLLNPFEKIKTMITNYDLIVLNIEGLVSNNDKPFTFDGTPLLNLKKICGKTPIYINFKNDKMMADGAYGISYMYRFLNKHNFLFSLSSLRPFLYDNVSIFNLVDSTIITHTRCISNMIPINIGQSFDTLIIKYIKHLCEPNKTNIALIKYEKNVDYFISFAKKIIIAGISIVIGYGNCNMHQNNF